MIAVGLAVLMIALVCAGISIFGAEGIAEFQRAMEEAPFEIEQRGAGTGTEP